MPGPKDDQEITTLGVGAQPQELPEGILVMLRVIAGAEPGRGYQITSLPVTLGRDAICGVSLPDPKISRQHAAMVLQGADLVIKDLGSTNGTFVNDKRVKEAVLNHGDQLRLGNTVLEFILSQAKPGRGN